MKLEVIDRSREESIATYVVPDTSMLSFQEWKHVAEVVIPLDQLSAVVTELNSIDPVTGLPSMVATSVDFYLPDPVKDTVVERLAKHRMDRDVSSGQLSDLLQEVAEQACTPPLKLSTILLAVAEELSRNHLPNDAYKVRISDEQ